MKKFVYIFLSLFILIGVYAPSVFAYPDPLPKNFLTNSYYDDNGLDGFAVSVHFHVNKTGGHNSSRDIRTPQFNTSTIHPHVMGKDKPLAFRWAVVDPGILDVVSCNIGITGQDPGNTYNKNIYVNELHDWTVGPRAGNLSAFVLPGKFYFGNISFDPSSLKSGNYFFSLSCDLDNGQKLTDFVYVYLLDDTSRLKTPPTAVMTDGTNNASVSNHILSLEMNGNQGFESLYNFKQSSGSVISPLALTRSQLRNANISFTTNNTYKTQWWWFGKTYFTKCIFSVSDDTRSYEIYEEIRTPMFGKMTVPKITQTFTSANLKLSVWCLLENGKSLYDFITVYQTDVGSGGGGGGGITPPIPSAPTLNMTANPSTITVGESTKVSWTSTKVKSCENGTQPVKGNFTASPTKTTSYEIKCTDINGKLITAKTTVTVNPEPNQPPDGYFNNVDNTNCKITGWALDPDEPSKSINVHVYRDGEDGKGGTILTSLTADIYDKTVNDVRKVTGNHAFSADLSPYLSDGKKHSLYVYGIDSETAHNSRELTLSPKFIQCPPRTIIPGKTPPSVDIKIESL